MRRWGEKISYCTLKFESTYTMLASAYSFKLQLEQQPHTSPRYNPGRSQTLSNSHRCGVIDARRYVLFDNILWTTTLSQINRLA